MQIIHEFCVVENTTGHIANRSAVIPKILRKTAGLPLLHKHT